MDMHMEQLKRIECTSVCVCVLACMQCVRGCVGAWVCVHVCVCVCVTSSGDLWDHLSDCNVLMVLVPSMYITVYMTSSKHFDHNMQRNKSGS